MAQNVGKNIQIVSVIMIIVLVGGIAVYQGFFKKVMRFLLEVRKRTNKKSEKVKNISYSELPTRFNIFEKLEIFILNDFKRLIYMTTR